MEFAKGYIAKAMIVVIATVITTGGAYLVSAQSSPDEIITSLLGPTPTPEVLSTETSSPTPLSTSTPLPTISSTPIPTVINCEQLKAIIDQKYTFMFEELSKDWQNPSYDPCPSGDKECRLFLISKRVNEQKSQELELLPESCKGYSN